jgi:hypothetical protein
MRLKNSIVNHAHGQRWDIPMAKWVVLCQADDCEAENEDYEDHHDTYWFTCIACGYDNEVVHYGGH